MDMVKLVEEGKYKKEELNAEHRAFISGIEFAEESVDGFFGDGDTEDEFSSTLGAIKKEITDAVIGSVKDYLHILKCEAIVSFGDEEACEKDGDC